MKKIKMSKLGAVLVTIFLIGAMLILPMSGAINTTRNEIIKINNL